MNQYEAKNFEHLLGINGLSDQLLKNHFSLYGGYITNANKLADILNSFIKEEKTSLPEYAELKRRFSWEWNGMRLHELYFENLAKESKALNKESGLYKKIESEFGSFEAWEKDFKSLCGIRGIGWAILYYDKENGKLFNAWINEHDAGHLSGATPILIIDVFEHAYMLDYGIKKADYIENVFKIIDWKAAEERFKE